MQADQSIVNHLLIATQKHNHTLFERALVYLCEHDAEQGSSGFMINRTTPYTMDLIYQRLELERVDPEQRRRPLFYGGPLESERGFVLHRPPGAWQASLIDPINGITITTSNDIIRHAAQGHGPADMMVVLGYMAWAPGQLHQQIMANDWLVCPCAPELLYDVPLDKRWAHAGAMLGIDMQQFITGNGHA